jgi:hypothetical protein
LPVGKGLEVAGVDAWSYVAHFEIENTVVWWREEK